MENIQYVFKNPEEDLKKYILSDPELHGSDSLLDEKEKLIVADLKLRQIQLTTQTQNFLEHQMIQINYKKNMCMLTRCYDNIFIETNERNICAKKCAFGQEKFKNYAKNMYSKYNICR